MDQYLKDKLDSLSETEILEIQNYLTDITLSKEEHVTVGRIYDMSDHSTYDVITCGKKTKYEKSLGISIDVAHFRDQERFGLYRTIESIDSKALGLVAAEIAEQYRVVNKMQTGAKSFWSENELVVTVNEKEYGRVGRDISEVELIQRLPKFYITPGELVSLIRAGERLVTFRINSASEIGETLEAIFKDRGYRSFV